MVKGGKNRQIAKEIANRRKKTKFDCLSNMELKALNVAFLVGVLAEGYNIRQNCLTPEVIVEP